MRCHLKITWTVPLKGARVTLIYLKNKNSLKNYKRIIMLLRREEITWTFISLNFKIFLWHNLPLSFIRIQQGVLNAVQNKIRNV